MSDHFAFIASLEENDTLMMKVNVSNFGENARDSEKKKNCGYEMLGSDRLAEKIYFKSC